MNQYYLPIITLFVGAILGVLTNFFTTIIRKRESVSIKIFDEVIKARNEVAEVVSKLVHFSGNLEAGNTEQLKYRDEIIKLYYKFYDFLPLQVLNALMLLEVALDNPSLGPYKMVKNRLLPVQKDEMVDFIKSCTRIENGVFSASMQLRHSSAAVVNNEIIRLHARLVLHTLNTFASLGGYISLINNLKKK